MNTYRGLSLMLSCSLCLLNPALSLAAVSNQASFTGTNPDGSAITGTLTSNSVSTKVAPLITSALTDTVTVGVPYSYTITAQNNPTSGTLTFKVAGLPNGLTFDGSKTISGTITSTNGSPVNVTLTATNIDGFTNATLVLTLVNAQNANITLTKVAKDVNGNIANAVKSGDIIVYTLTYTNTATTAGADASNVIVTDGIPTGTQYVGSSLSGTGCPTSYTGTGQFSCSVGTVKANGGTGTITFKVTAN